MIRYVGLDVHKRVVEACIVDHAGKVVQRERFALYPSALETFAKCVLRPHVTRVLVSNPMAVSVRRSTGAVARALHLHKPCRRRPMP